MRQQVELHTQERVLMDSIKELEKLNKQLAKLQLRKEELTNEVIGILGHDHAGQKSYVYDIYKVTVKTPVIYSLDKKLYESGDVYLEDAFNPIKTSTAYSVDKKLTEAYMEKAPLSVREALTKLISLKPGKPSVSIEENV